MRINPTERVTRIAARVARHYQDQIRRETERALSERFAALDHGIVTAATSIFSGGIPVTVVPDPDDPLEQVWRLTCHQARRVSSDARAKPPGLAREASPTSARRFRICGQARCVGRQLAAEGGK